MSAMEALGASTLFSGMSEEERSRLAGMLRPFAASADTSIGAPGAPVDELHLLVEGTVEIGEPVSERLGAGDILGETGLNETVTQLARVRVVTPVSGYVLDLGEIEELRRDGDPLAASLLRILSRHLAALVRRIDADETAPPTVSSSSGAVSAGPVPGELAGEIAALACFDGLDAEALGSVLAALRSRTLARGDVLFSEGEAADAAFIVLRGTVEISRSRGERHVRLATLGPGRLLGELSLLDLGPRTATCVALEPSIVLEISDTSLSELLRTDSAAAIPLLETVNHSLIAALGRGYRRRGQRPSDRPAPTAPDATSEAGRERLIERIRTSVIGEDAVFEGPFGPRRNVYADYTASGRALSFIEDFIRNEVLPLYANTHTEASAMGLQTTRLREDARRIIHQAVNCTEADAVIFCGSGATGAIDKLSTMLGLKLPSALVDRFNIRSALAEADRPVVFIGPYEHHSNELPWRESVADLVTIAEDADGRIDLAHLERELVAHADRPLKVGSFSAASNVTGIMSNTEEVAILLHRHGALSCWDYAAAGPYLPIDMNPDSDLPDGHLAYKDAVFLSPHKFVGGPGTPGVLVAKRDLFSNRTPSVPGGGTVMFVTPYSQGYHPSPEAREEAGTPAIVESIRAGLVFDLKRTVGAEEIHRREHRFVRRALDSWGENPRIQILGNPQLDRLAIVSLGLRHGDGLLHAHFAAALLNDLFGIQARSGCFCAGPYVYRMIGIEEDYGDRMEAEVMLGHEGAKLAFLRLNFNYFLSETTFEYLVAAIHFVADHGWKFLPQYRFDAYSGLWHHRQGRSRPTLTLHDATFASGSLEFVGERATMPESALPGFLAQAHRLVAELESSAAAQDVQDPKLSAEFESVRWFPLPSEALAQLQAAATS